MVPEEETTLATSPGTRTLAKTAATTWKEKESNAFAYQQAGSRGNPYHVTAFIVLEVEPLSFVGGRSPWPEAGNEAKT